MKTLIAFSVATLYGLSLRYFFAFNNNIVEVMSLSLVVIAPMAIGFLTVALSGLKRVTNGWAAFFRPWATTLLLLFFTIALSLEGAICWIMIYPLFSIMAGFGGLIAYYYMRHKEKKSERDSPSDILDDFDRKDTLKSSVLLVMPLLFGIIEHDRLLSPATYTISCETVVNAPAPKVWAALIRVNDIQAVEDNSFFTRFLGLPRHLHTSVDTLAVGGKRTAFYERGLYFEERVTEIIPGERLRVAIKADPGSVPPSVLDEHIVIGGRHFKALEDTYQVTALPDGSCRLSLSGKIVINTPFNWYAGLWARWVLEDLFQNLLGIINQRACAPQ